MQKQKAKAESDHEPLVADIVYKNIKKMLQLRQQSEDRRALPNRLADKLTRYIGSSSFAVVHLVFIFLWFCLNSKFAPKDWIFDPSPYTLLSTVLTIEALFIAIFILMNQNEMKDESQKREDLSIQIDLLTEHEVTQIMSIVENIQDHFDKGRKSRAALEPKVETSPESVLQVIEQETGKMENSPAPEVEN